MLGQEEYAHFMEDMKRIEADSLKELDRILNSEMMNSGVDFQTIIDLINFITNFFS